jgi:hypothetical protein
MRDWRAPREAPDPERAPQPRLSPGQAKLSRQIIAGTLVPGVEQVIDVFDGKIVVRKPIAEMESRLEGPDENGNGKAKKK